MAKRPRNIGSAQSAFDRVLASIPARAEFRIQMNADSTNEVWADVDTNLDDGEAWLIYGGEFFFFVPSLDLPTGPHILNTDGNWLCLQVHRNDDSELLLPLLDDDLMFTWLYGHDQLITGASGSMALGFTAPFRFGHRTISFSEKLRVLFRTYTDEISLSDTTIWLEGYLLYDRIKAPSIGQSKLGQIADL